MNSMDMEQTQEQDKRKDQDRRQEQDSKYAKDQRQEEMQRSQKAGVDWAIDALKVGEAVWEQCKNGAIEDQRNTIAEEVCARFTNALGAEAARSLGQGVAKITLGEPDGVQQTAAATVEICLDLAKDVEALEGGQLPEVIAQRAVEEELRRRMEADKQSRR